MNFKHIIVTFVFLLVISKVKCQCGDLLGGALIQQITEKHNASLGLFSDEYGNIFYVDGIKPALCVIYNNATNLCIDISGVSEVVSAFRIQGTHERLIGITPHDLIYLNLFFDSNKRIVKVTADVIKQIEYSDDYHLVKGMTDNKGRIWIDSVAKFLTPNAQGKVYRISSDKRSDQILIEYKYTPFGIAFSSDNKSFFHIDSTNNVILKYKFNDTKGEISDPTIIYSSNDYPLYEGRIGAITVGEDNSLWIGFLGSGIIIQYNWKKEKIEQVILSSSKFPISMVFGGKKFNVLFVGTTNSSNRPTQDGAVFAISATKGKGLASYPFIET